MPAKLHVRSDDMVEVIVGNYRGARGRVLRAMPRERKVVVEGVNLVWKHVKPDRRNPRGGRIQIEAPVDASNVLPICPNRDCPRFDRGVRVSYQLSAEGTKTRRCVKCGAVLRTSQ